MVLEKFIVNGYRKYEALFQFSLKDFAYIFPKDFSVI